MSETKHTPLPWRHHGSGTKVKNKAVSAIVGSKYGDFRDTVIASYIWEEADAQLIVTSVNARPKVEELVAAVNKLKGHLEETGEYRICRADKEQMGLPDQMTIGQVLFDVEEKAREVEAALGGKAEQSADTNSHEVRKARGAM
jgi:hypothetical protein